MARIKGSEAIIVLMVNCKTYPAVSKKYTETVCTGGVQPNGEFVRLYPVPFRFLDTKEQYGRWDVIRVQVYRDTNDDRRESWHLEPGTLIECIDKITTDRQKWEWMKPTVHHSTEAMNAQDITNGCVQIEPIELYYKDDPKEWTDSQKEAIAQGDLFATKEQMASLADRVPWQFRLKYREANSGREGDCKVLAWSYYQGLRRRMQTDPVEVALEFVSDRIKSSIFRPDRTLFGIFGTHRLSGHWMISSLYYVPTDIIVEEAQKAKALF